MINVRVFINGIETNQQLKDFTIKNSEIDKIVNRICDLHSINSKDEKSNTNIYIS